MKKIIFITIFLILLTGAIYAVEKLPQIKGVTTSKDPENTTRSTAVLSHDSQSGQQASKINSKISDNQSSPSADTIFNIHLLLTQKIDDLSNIIGEPFPNQLIDPPVDGRFNSNTWQRGFEKKGIKLYANYNIDNGTINSLAILGDNIETLLKQWNLDEKSTQ